MGTAVGFLMILGGIWVWHKWRGIEEINWVKSFFVVWGALFVLSICVGILLAMLGLM
jgi:hypothetical protein